MNTTARGYGWKHQQRRAIVARQIAMFGAICCRCGGLIRPGDRNWHLDHRDDVPKSLAVYAGVSHAHCNESAGARKQNRASKQPAPALAFFHPTR